MIRRLVPLAVILSVVACRPYERYGYVTSEFGLIPADAYAKYGPDQAVSVAIGREFGKGFDGLSAEGYAKQTDAALLYAKKFPQVSKIVADTLGHRLVLTFADG